MSKPHRARAATAFSRGARSAGLVAEIDLPEEMRNPWTRHRPSRRLGPATLLMPETLHRICSIVFATDHHGRVLLQNRRRRPNLGRWTCCGGKLKSERGESPFDCAVRELHEETGFRVSPDDLQLFGVVNETAYEGTDHWLMFLFRLRQPLPTLPPACVEGTFRFFRPVELLTLPLPPVDRRYLWPLFFEQREALAALRINCAGGDWGEAIYEQGAPIPTLEDILPGVTSRAAVFSA